MPQTPKAKILPFLIIVYLTLLLYLKSEKQKIHKLRSQILEHEKALDEELQQARAKSLAFMESQRSIDESIREHQSNLLIDQQSSKSKSSTIIDAAESAKDLLSSMLASVGSASNAMSPTDNSRQNCENMLTSGSWTNFKYTKTDPEAHLSLPNGDWAYSGKFQPNFCQLVDYKFHEIEKCLMSETDNFGEPLSVHIIGDSRARLMYRVLSARMKGQISIEDVKVHDDMSNRPFSYHWSQSFNGKAVSEEKSEVSGFKNLFKIFTSKNPKWRKTPQLIIIYEQFLHPAMDHLFYPNKRDYNLIEEYFKESLDHFRDSIIPALIHVITTNANERGSKSLATIVVLASEGSNRVFEGWNDKLWLDLQNYYNTELRNIIKSNSKYIYYMDSNIKTAYGPNGENLLADGTHKLIKGAVQKLPPSLIADTDMILNLHCNERRGDLAEDVCCRGW